ncbi:esterase-like activity of phytase family protein [Pasteurella testudinis]|uniref:esterase-like activity of phytase family protein n=1 Tax=Pasteurella testudinis TaxID=761 RepID=UPI00405A040B
MSFKLFQLKTLSLAVTTALSINSANAAESQYFNRVATFAVCSQLQAECNDDRETSAEILYADKEGKTVVYSDSPAKQLGFVDISDLAQPKAKKIVKLNGEPTSVVIKARFALVAVNTSKDYVDTSGELQVFNLDSYELLATLPLGGQPDSVAISPDGNFAAVAIENERDEDKNKGALPQLPAGYLSVIDTADSNPANWTVRKVELTGLDNALFPEDPEPEYVDINQDNIAVLTLQENNAIVLVDLAKGEVINHFSAGSVNLTQVDATEEKPLQIKLTESLNDVAREPDGVAWIDNQHFAIANEGDWKGGSRGFSIFNTQGDLVWDSGNALDHLAVQFGHYPDKRSENKGNEPENVEVGVFNGERLLFVNSERASLVFVYNVDNPAEPKFKQALPVGVAPEGAYAIASHNALVVASEADSRKDKIRSSISIYEYGATTANYPTLQSVVKDGSPIPWAALSGLAADPRDENKLYSIEDSFFGGNRIFVLDVAQKPAQIVDAIRIKDSHKLLSQALGAEAKLVNDDLSVNLDPEGIAVDQDGNFWLASEGAGTVGDEKRPLKSPNLLLKLTAQGEISEVVQLPPEVNAMQLRFGFEGVAVDQGKVYVAFQRAWGKEQQPRIGIYDLTDKQWSFVFYPLENVASQNGGWVGISDLTARGNGIFWVLERDDQGGPDAAIKRIYQIDLSVVNAGDTVSKTLVRDLMDDLKAANGLVPEKIEGLTVSKNGRVFIVNDNDGVDDNSGETQLLEVMQQ